MVGACLLYVRQNNNLGWANSRSEAALHMAEAGVNDEIQYIAANVGATSAATTSSGSTGQSTSPAYVNSPATTSVSPFTNAVVNGRYGTISGATGNYWVFTTLTNPATNPSSWTAWDGKSVPFYIVSTAYVNSSWRRVYVTSGTTKSVFASNAIFAIDAIQGSSNAIQLSNATVTVTGTMGTNGKVSGSSSTMTASNAIDAYLANTTTQFSSSNLSAGGTLYIQSNAVIYPTVTTVLSRATGKTWTQLSTSNSNSTGVYTYASSAQASTINTTNCVQATGVTMGNMLSNQSNGGYTNAWANAANKPGTTNGTFLVSGATNASPIQITTVKKHGLSSGDQVTISGVGGDTAANGTFYAKVPSGNGSQTTFTLYSDSGLSTPVAGNAAYTSGGVGVKNISIVSIINGTVTTSAQHNLSTGNSVTITGDTAVNGTYTITVPNGNAGKLTFTLNNYSGTASGTGGAAKLNVVQTLIFEPGDYYFTAVNVLSDPTTEIVIDSQAYASGGAAGNVRFWIQNNLNGTANSSVQNDVFQNPINATIASTSSAPDPTLFHIYYAVDKGVFTLQRPSGYVNYDGSAAGNFNTYGAVYAVSKIWGDTSSLNGTTIGFLGQSGSINLNGALIADQVSFQGTCNIIFNYPADTSGNGVGDPEGGAGTLSGYTDG